MQVIANIDQADIGLVEQAKSVKFTVDAFPGKDFDGKIQQMRLNPVNVQNVVTYNVVIDVNNPEQKLKPGMTANLTITIDERNNVLKVPNSALRFTPQDANGQRSGSGSGQRTVAAADRRQGQTAADAAMRQCCGARTAGAAGEGGETPVCAGDAPVLAGSDAHRLGDGPGRQTTVAQDQGWSERWRGNRSCRRQFGGRRNGHHWPNADQRQQTQNTSDDSARLRWRAANGRRRRRQTVMAI